MSVTALAAITSMLALLPALVFWRNLRAYLPPPPFPTQAGTNVPVVSVLIPARNEAAGIGAAVHAARASRGVTLEVIVLDDHSEDTTAAIVAAIAAQDARVRLVSAPPLPPGWCGKQHACAVLAQQARSPLLVFVDADVRLAPEGLARLAAFIEYSGADLASGFPHQETGTFVERLVIPLMHFVLLGFLPIWRMRQQQHPAYGAGCGQLFLARRLAYEQVGGHGAIRTSLHDGITLPRAFRAAGFRTDLCDVTDLATCRMYQSATALWHGLAKNATEGLGAPSTILPATGLLLGGQLVPPVLLGVGLLEAWPLPAVGLAALGTLAAYAPRLIAVRRFRQSWIGALLHPLGLVCLLSIQWYALGRRLLGRPATWKGRQYAGRLSA